jgi:aminoglycoside 6-adenylyltransferase
MNTDRDEIRSRLRNWALKNRDVQSVVIGGSRGGDQHHSDEYSDIDVAVFCRRRKHYDEDLQWVKELGEPAYRYKDFTRVPGMSGVHKIYFTNGVQVDLFFWDSEILHTGYIYLRLRDSLRLSHWAPLWIRKLVENRFAFFPKWIARGYSVLVDKRNLRRKMEYIDRKFKYRRPPISLAQLQDIVAVFWAFAYTSAIYICRGELLAAKTIGDRIIKAQLLFLIELYIRLLKGQDILLLDSGRKLEKWAPGFITGRLSDIYGRYDTVDAWRSLVATMDLFSTVFHALVTEFPEFRAEDPEAHFRKLICSIGAKLDLPVQ